MNRVDLFVTPVWSFDIDDVDTARLVDHANSLYEIDTANRNPNNYIGEARSAGLKWISYLLSKAQIKSNSALEKIVALATENASQCIRELGAKESCSLVLNGCWYNINGPDDVVFSHVHPGTTIVAVYYFKVPPDSGNIVFQHGDNTRCWNYAPKYFVDRNRFTEVFHQIDAKENLMLIFPGSLMHFVTKNLSQEDRMCMTFNFAIKDTTTLFPNNKNFNKT